MEIEEDQRCQIPNFAENSVELQQIEEEEDDNDDDEALSLSDLPLIHHHQGKNTEQGEEIIEEALIQDDFDFCSLSTQSEMCAADELFFQGQILPLRHSISRSVSRSESMDHFCSGRLISSRSSSISSSGSSSVTAGRHNSRSRLPPRNQFHSHPSPSPRLSFSNHTHRTTTTNGSRNSVRKSSSVWNILRLGLVTTPPEIAFHDLKTRNCKNFGSRNSTSSNGSSVSSSKPKKKARGLLGGCNCSLDAVDAVTSKVVVIKRSASENDVEALHPKRENVEEIKPQKIKKKHMSHHRTFEWLKQLSVEVTADES